MFVHSSAMDASSTAGPLMKPAAVGESEASVEGHVTPRRRGSVSMKHTATRMTTASVISRSSPTDSKSLISETPIKHKVISIYIFIQQIMVASKNKYKIGLFVCLLLVQPTSGGSVAELVEPKF